MLETTSNSNFKKKKKKKKSLKGQHSDRDGKAMEHTMPTVEPTCTSDMKPNEDSPTAGPGVVRDTQVDVDTPPSGGSETPSNKYQAFAQAHNTTSHSAAISSNATWEEVTQFALNCSILSGTFEDLRILAFSQRSSSGICAPRSLHANSALVRRALKHAHTLLDDSDNVLSPRDEVEFIGGSSSSVAAYDYAEDSDLEDVDASVKSDHERKEDVAHAQPPHETARSVGSPDTFLDEPEDPRQEPKRGIADSATPTDDFVSITPSSAKTDERGYDSPPAAEPTNAANAPSDVSSTLPSTALHINASGSSPPQEPKDDLRVKGARCIVSPNIAFRTWRSFIFFAYTGRVAFAPLRSQGFVLHDDKRDPTQLPICSPKSMYRLAAIYGSEELKMQAGTDIQAKLSTQNVLDELFSKFTSRFPEIEDMELNFLLTHIQHPDVTIRLPQWIDRFARGDLRECAGTIGTLIHKLACAAVTPTSTVGAPKGPSSCPRGCPMPTIRTQWRCSTCGYVMT